MGRLQVAGKKPWCAEGVCSPAVPMHTKGCARRDMFLKEREQTSERFIQELFTAQKKAMEDARSGSSTARSEIPILITEAGSHHLPAPAPVVEKKPWWKRVFSG